MHLENINFYFFLLLRKYNIKVDVDGILCRVWIGVLRLMLGPLGRGLLNTARTFVFIKSPESFDES